ncbi:hypothetical protein AAFN86_22940 [Roseomonas sp. CAU 1739]|uniref:hypothetical protein n=1 Tax=Roseomonas sp. CAU 1739 TaxID=3140364 RepID=UPI00325B61E3
MSSRVRTPAAGRRRKVGAPPASTTSPWRDAAITVLAREPDIPVRRHAARARGLPSALAAAAVLGHMVQS